jgi:D-alanyl-D-alanine dipeptidase
MSTEKNYFASYNVSMTDVVALSKQRCKEPIFAKLKYATPKNFVGRSIKGYPQGTHDFALMALEAAEKLCEVQNYLIEKYGYGLLVYDAYRPKQAVQDFMLWSKEPAANNYEMERKNKHYPKIEKNQLFSLGYVAEDSGHCYGNTVDLVLIDLKTGKKLDMGARFDYMDETSHVTANTNQIGEAACNNRKILSETMQKFDFEPYHEEYWHYSYKGKAGRATAEPINVEITPEMKNFGVR